VAQVVSPTLARFGTPEQAGLGILFLKYSRDQEAQADQLGVEYATRDGWDPRAIPATYHTLARIAEAAGARTPTYLSTHPDPLGREVTTRAQAVAAAGTRTDLRIDHEAYVRALDGLVYGDDPRQGYFEGGRFYQPTLRFQLEFPAAWQYQAGHSSVVAANADGTVVLQLTALDLGGLSPADYVSHLQAAGRITGAVGDARVFNRQPGWSGRVAVKDDQGATDWLGLAILTQSPGHAYLLVGQWKGSDIQREANGFGDHGLLETVTGSFRTLDEPARLAPEPARVKIVAAPRTGLFQEMVPTLGPQAISLAETAVLNGVELDDQVRKGELLKIVTPARVK